MEILPLVNEQVSPNGSSIVTMRVLEPIDLPEELAKALIKRGVAELPQKEKEESTEVEKPKRRPKKSKDKSVDIEKVEMK